MILHRALPFLLLVSCARADEPTGAGIAVMYVLACMIWGGVACLGILLFLCTAFSCDQYTRLRDWLNGDIRFDSDPF